MSLDLSIKASKVKPSSTLEITAKAKALKAEGIDIVGFGAGEPDFNTPSNICNAAKKAIDIGFTKYTPASGTTELKEAISEKFKKFNNLEYSQGQIVVSNGGKHSLTNVFQAILNPEDEVIIPVPYWLTYPEIVKLFDGKPVFVSTTKENGFKLDIESLEKSITSKTKALILNTPSNPTGMIYSRDELEKIAKIAIKYDFYVVSDEMYENLTYDGKRHISIASLGKEIYDRTITCSGMSKAYSMTGWRIGYTGSSEELAKVMGSIQSHQTSNPNSIAQYASVEALKGPTEELDNMILEFSKRKTYMYDRINSIKYLSMLKPEGAFYGFVDISEILGKKYEDIIINNVFDIAKILLNKFHVAVIPCVDFGAPNYIRLSYAISIETIKKGLDRIEEFINSLK